MNATLHLLRRSLASVAHVKATVPEEHASAPLLGTEREGTCAFVDDAGHALTANYVVLGAESMTVTTADGRTLAAEIAGRDFASGLALLRIPDAAAPPFVLAPAAELALGDDVFLIGSSDGGPRVTSGGVTSLGPFDAYWEYLLDCAILTTATNPGLGGGPLCDRLGRMIGVVSLSLNEIGRFSMAIPIDPFLEHRDDLLRFGRPVKRASRAWIGLFVTTLHDHVVVAGLVPGGPAEAQGLRAGDVVLSVDGVPISDRVALYRQIWTHPSGDRVRFTVFRNNEVRTLDLVSRSVEEMFA